MGFFEDLLEDNIELLQKLVTLMEGKEAKADIKLDGVKFDVGQTEVKLGGTVKVTIVQKKKK